MHELETLRQRFARDGIELEAGPGGLTTLVLTHRGGSARICVHGAHVLGYQPAFQAPVLWLSSRSSFREGQPIRGGIPICWPWFAEHPFDPKKPAHGFARTSTWTLLATASTDQQKSITLRLHDDAETRALWPHAFQLDYQVCLGSTLHASLNVRNTGTSPIIFTGALHSYFDVSDVAQVSLEGLSGSTYLDKLDGFRRKAQARQPLRFIEEIDRIYTDTSTACSILDHRRRRRIVVTKTGSNSTVVWNPWAGRARRLADFPDDGYRRMLCVETANAADDVITLAPGAIHTLSLCLQSRPL